MKCLHCNIEIELPKKKFCCTNHKTYYYNKQNNYERQKEYRSRSPRHFMNGLTHKKIKGRDLSVEFLDNLYKSQNGKCAISGKEMTYITGKGRVSTNISVDRIDSSKGYEEGNCQLVCLQVNFMKQNLTDSELIDWCLEIGEYQLKRIEEDMDLDLEGLWDISVKQAKAEANACYPEDCKEKRVFEECLINKYYNQRVNPNGH